jgi:class 3 adenylate cyclase
MATTTDRLTAAELGLRSGTTEEFVERLVGLAILTPGEDGSFEVADVYRARFVGSCARGGLPLDGISQAIREGRVSLDFMAQSHFRFAGLSNVTFREIAGEIGADVDLLLDMEEAFGSPRPGPDDLARDDIVDRMELLRAGIGMGIDGSVLIRLGRVYADAMRRIAEAEGHVYHSYIEMPLLRSGMTGRQVTELANAFGQVTTPLQEQALLALYRRHQERVWTEDILQHVETALEEMGVYQRVERPSAMAFLDVAGYTRLTEEQGDRAAAELAITLGRLVQGDAQEHRGRPVKWLGDGVMVFFPDPADAVEGTLAMVRRIPDAGLPMVHAGIASGPIVVQDGDYFGSTVNLASRLAGRAGGGQTFVTDEIASTVSRPGVAFREVGPAELKGIARPVRVHEAVPAGGTRG